ncbi:MAG: complex I NDUFA9 subunit family protein [Gammaproteobacteria bacterium]|nr:complex I NDUFA9 subunit family protein [Gammaproteobacteria bacterium]
MTVKPPPRSICVLGGTGFVGRAIVNQLVRLGYRVRIPTRSRQRHRDLLVFPGVDLIVADVHDERVLARLVAGCDAVVNLIGILNERGHDGSGFKHVHVDLVEKLLRACNDADVDRLIHMSALKANADRGPSHYLRTKGQAEQLVRNQSGDIRYTIFKPSTIFGPGDSFTNRFAGLLKVLPVLPLPCADARMSPVYVEDVALAFVRAVEDGHTSGRTYELCGPEIYSLGEVVGFLKRQLRIRRAVVPLPKPLGRLQAAVADYLIPGKPFSIDNFESLSVAGVCSENGLTNLGIAPKSMATIVPAYLGRTTRPAPPRTPSGAG